MAAEKPNSRVLDASTGLASCTVTVSVHFDTALPADAWLNYWLSTDGGVGYGWLDKIPASGAVVTFEFKHLVPYADESWRVKVATGVPGYEYPPDKAVESNVFLVSTLSAPANNLVRNAAISSIDYLKQDNGQYTFTFNLDYDTVVDPTFWTTSASVQWVTADGTPCPEDPSGAQERFGIVQGYDFGIRTPGGHSSNNIGPWWVPPAEWTGRTMRIRIYVLNRKFEQTVQLWPDGRDYCDIPLEVKYWVGGNYPNIPAPEVTQFDAGTVNPDGTFTRLVHYDTLNEKVLIDWAAYLPDDIGNLGFVQVWFKINAGKWEKGLIYDGRLAADGLIRDAISLTGDQRPKQGDTIALVCNSANKLGIHNQNPPGTPSGPSVTITVGAPDKGITAGNISDGALGAGVGKDPTGTQIVVKMGAGVKADAAGYLAINPGTSIDTQDGKTSVKQGSLSSNFFAAGALGADLTKYSPDKRPVGVYYGLPSALDSTVPEVVFNTSDGYVYRKVGASWTKAVAPADIMAGTIAASVTMAGTVYANRIVENGGGISGCRLTLTLNNVTASVANLWDAAYGQYAGALVQLNGGNNRALMSYAGFAAVNANGYRAAEISGASEGVIALSNATNTLTIEAHGNTGAVSARAFIGRDGYLNTRITIDGVNGTVDAQYGYKVGGVFVIDSTGKLASGALPLNYLDNRYATAGHSHDSQYSLITHVHDTRYYLKSEVYTKAQVDALLAALGVPYHTHGGTTSWVADHEHGFTTDGPN